MRKVTRTITIVNSENNISCFLVISPLTFLITNITSKDIIPGNQPSPSLIKPAEIKIINNPVSPVIFVNDKSIYNAKN